MSALGPPAGGVGSSRSTRGDRPAPTLVLKFGSSVLRDEADLAVAVHEIYRWWRLGYRVVAVVSAFAGVTDDLVAATGAASIPQLKRPTSASAGADAVVNGIAEHTIDAAGSSAFAVLLAAGERHTAALLVLELDRAGIPAQVLDPAGIGLTTRDTGLDADLTRVDRRRVERALDACPVAVLPGFQAVDGRGVATLLGRGGSDMTAVFIAHRLGARCRLLKDVPGVFDRRPPAAVDPLPHVDRPLRLFSSMTWQEAAAAGNGVVQERALAFAERERLPLEVAAPARGFATCIGDRLASFVDPRDTVPLTVAILGLGSVGRAVYRRLATLPRHFRIVGVAVRHLAHHRGETVPDELLCDDPQALLDRSADVIVEALPGVEPARQLIERALATGRTVVSANKAALAAAPHLLATGSVVAGRLRASAAVGGAVPVLETASRLAADGALAAVHGVLNGTCNFVLGRLEAGETLAAAVSEAQRHGFAEADPTADLDGSDVARKLVLIARAAFGVELTLDAIRRQSLAGIDPEGPRRAAAADKRLRVVGSLAFRGGRLDAAVRLRILPSSHFLAGARAEENRVIFERRGARPVYLAGKGAGGRPTAEAILADLLDLWRLRRVEAATRSPDAPPPDHVAGEMADTEVGRLGHPGGDGHLAGEAGR